MNREVKFPAAPCDVSGVIVRPLNADDAPAYRALRARILQMGDGKYFSDSYVRENGFACDEQWREWCSETQAHCTIGSFIGDRLIGIMGIILYGPPEDKTVEWEATWMEPHYRRFGIARQSYHKVQQWTRARGYEKAVVFIRADNVRSREIREKQGAVYVGTKRNEVWADGSVADVHRFSIDLRDMRGAQALRTIEGTLQAIEVDPVKQKVAV